VRGSPLLRTFLILAALVVSGIGFARLTHIGTSATAGQGEEVSATTESKLIPAKIYLSLSRPVGFLEIKIGEKKVGLTRVEQWDFIGTATIDFSNPIVTLKTLPNDPKRRGVARIFAKLVVEADGKETFTHVFDADGDIDDFVELPF
jgi:hypothetical protein